MNVQKLFLLSLIFTGALGLQACEQEGPLENAGETIDEPAEDAGDALEEACEDVTDSNCD